MLNGIAKGRAVTTRANRKLQVDALKKALGLNHERDNDEFNSSNKDDVDFDESRDSFSNCDSNRNSNNATRDNSSS